MSDQSVETPMSVSPPSWSPTNPLEIKSFDSAAADSNAGWQYCDVVKVNANYDGYVQVVLRGGLIPGPVDVWFFISGPGQEKMLAVALTACSARQKVWAWVASVEQGNEVKEIHIAPLGP